MAKVHLARAPMQPAAPLYRPCPLACAYKGTKGVRHAGAK
jgi:hypothetical protein